MAFKCDLRVRINLAIVFNPHIAAPLLRLIAKRATELKALIQRALAELPPPLRQAVVMRDLQEFSYQEIADKLELPEGTVKSRINRGRLELRRQLDRLQDVPVARPSTPGGRTS
jgi:RNA polymerase sigma factor (sigma-70 family)